MATTIYPDVLVLRHGRTEWNALGRLQGMQDSPLDSLGRAQAKAQRDILQHLDISKHEAFCSPLGRTRATAKICLEDLEMPVRYDDRLREIDMGDWQGQRVDDIRARSPDLFEGDIGLRFYRSIPNGETIDDLAARCGSFLADLQGPAVVVTHGITSRVLRCLLLGLSPDAFTEVPGGQGVVHEVTFGVHRTHE